jgi:hypothetical protein
MLPFSKMDHKAAIDMEYHLKLLSKQGLGTHKSQLRTCLSKRTKQQQKYQDLIDENVKNEIMIEALRQVIDEKTQREQRKTAAKLITLRRKINTEREQFATVVGPCDKFKGPALKNANGFGTPANTGFGTRTPQAFRRPLVNPTPTGLRSTSCTNFGSAIVSTNFGSGTNHAVSCHSSSAFVSTAFRDGSVPSKSHVPQASARPDEKTSDPPRTPPAAGEDAVELSPDDQSAPVTSSCKTQ